MTTRRRAPRLSLALDGKSWDDPALFDEMRAETGEGRESGNWSLWNWHDLDPRPTLLCVTFAIPANAAAGSGAEEFLEAVSRQLSRAFGLFCSERGWPEPGYRIRTIGSSNAEWSYRIELEGGPSAAGELKPSKLLIMGSPAQLSPFLGFETNDPVLGLPAKWIGRSSMEAAIRAELHVFDGPGVVAAHALHLLGEIWDSTIGFLDLQRWLLPALTTHADLISGLIAQHAGLLLKTVKALIADQLWLPAPAHFCELFASALPDLDPQEADPIFLKELLRKDIVPINLQRFTDPEGLLHAVEWRGEPDGDSAAQSRLLIRLADGVLHAQGEMVGGQPVVITDFDNRHDLGEVLAGPFPYLPVLSWAELPSHARLALVAIVDAGFEVDPSPWPYASFEVDSPAAGH